eukprot:TRINITY_DN2957_c0_g1_i7.p4 TRINITY_DN2957_c0_g1~~TRINITY_DN2957_c0_g1_i7.p4  ORF type:complete len:121 (+),score=19.48 TRINITY_DN2957_c0_g1_i7:75-437(+)
MDTVKAYRPGGSTHMSFTMGAISGVTGVYCYTRLKGALPLLGYGMIAAMFIYSGEEIQNGRNLFGHDVGMMTSASFAGLSAVAASVTRRILFPPLVVLGLGSAYYQYSKAQEWRDVYQDS